MTKDNDNLIEGWENVDIADEMEKQNVKYEQEHPENIKLEILKEHQEQIDGLEKIGKVLDEYDNNNK